MNLSICQEVRENTYTIVQNKALKNKTQTENQTLNDEDISVEVKEITKIKFLRKVSQ